MLAVAGGLVAALVLPGLVAAHPLGNFTINHYAGLRIEPDRILLDVVIDQAEIPTFQARMAFDTDGDGELSATETEAGRLRACTDLAASLDLTVDGQTPSTKLTEAGLTFPPGAGGLATMRTVCGYEAVLDTPLRDGSEIAFADRSFSERIGWREIVVIGSGVVVEPAAGAEVPRDASPSTRLTAYPPDLIAQAPSDTAVAIVATPGGPELPPLDIPDADPIAGQADTAVLGAVPAGASVPGGVAVDEIPAIFRSVDLTPVVLLVSLLTAAALGAGHALTPGHGKTLMAAYLVGSRGTPIHAAGLGLSVALSHTLGILALAGLVVGAQGLLPYEVVVTATPVFAALSIVAIGGWMLFAEGRRRWRARMAPTAGHEHDDGRDQAHAETHDHDHDHDDAHVLAAAHEHAHVEAHEHDLAAAHEHAHVEAHEHDLAAAHRHEATPAPGEHSHGGFRHSHLPADGSSISWRSLFVLGLAGGLIPSASALLILLSSIAAGRPAFGFVLVVAFGLGMALVMGGIGLTLVLARGRLDRVDRSNPLARASAYLPLVASVVVFGFGLFLTFQAVSGNTTL
jgi:ABC-type nickel/cobalt efflux system permease component RcnA